jgi:fucose 4-O-acetylase-like acetyltransferase
MSEALDSQKERFFDIDMAKGLAIIFVVLGHVVARDYPAGNYWYEILRPAIYRFHMPFFMFLSGWIFFHNLPKEHKFLPFIKKRVFRLLTPYILMVVVVLSAKFAASSFFTVDNSTTDIKNALYNVFWNTKDSNVFFVWYVYVLFVFNFISYIFLKQTKNNIFLMLFISFLMSLIIVPQIMFLDYIFFFYFFFCLGGVFYTYREKYYNFISKYKFELLGVFIVFLVMFKLNILYLNSDIPSKFIIGFLSIPALHGITKYVIKENKALLFIGKYSLTIYLFNVLAIGFLKAIMFKWHSWDNLYFLIYLPILLAGGIVLPILSYKFIFSHIPILNKILK